MTIWNSSCFASLKMEDRLLAHCLHHQAGQLEPCHCKRGWCSFSSLVVTSTRQPVTFLFWGQSFGISCIQWTALCEPFLSFYWHFWVAGFCRVRWMWSRWEAMKNLRKSLSQVPRFMNSLCSPGSPLTQHIAKQAWHLHPSFLWTLSVGIGGIGSNA